MLGANSAGGGGGATDDFAKRYQKLYEIERMWTPGGGEGRRVDLPRILIVLFNSTVCWQKSHK